MRSRRRRSTRRARLSGSPRYSKSGLRRLSTRACVLQSSDRRPRLLRSRESRIEASASIESALSAALRRRESRSSRMLCTSSLSLSRSALSTADSLAEACHRYPTTRHPARRAYLDSFATFRSIAVSPVPASPLCPLQAQHLVEFLVEALYGPFDGVHASF